jgi:hypothetical protein
MPQRTELLPTGYEMTITPQPWIAVSERLPETSGNVIIAWLSRASVGRHKKTLVGAAYFANGTFEHLEADFQVEPTHWMPFPEPPAD